ncbi:response regulator [Cohnella sp. GCM10020058]|uniref:response regulator n=1 Tax=Cohnella sp. GCM10020058 TaxID=3317330 RepID=UPI003630D2B5
MFNILVVDDEKIEREGIRFLIKKKAIPAEVADAENGEKALAYLETHPVDILFTDIKMPFMDGLQLAERAAAIQPNLKTIILSAYGEFDYAKRAIHLDVFHYLLKPVDVAEFTDVMQRVLKLCEEERERNVRENELLEGYHKGLRYEKERLLLDLLHGTTSADKMRLRAREARWEWDGTAPLRLLLLDTEHRFFDAVAETFSSRLAQWLPCPIDYVNLNEYQSVLFLYEETGDLRSEEQLRELGRTLQYRLKQEDGADATLVFSDTLDGTSAIASAYQLMEQTLESKFFRSEPAVFVAGAGEASTPPSQDLLQQTLEEIVQLMGRRERDKVGDQIERLFRDMEDSGKRSTIYVKYVCTEIVKALLENGERGREHDFQKLAERIYKTQNLAELKHILVGTIAKDIPQDEEVPRKAIEEVLHIIHRDYKQDIGLESLAEKVYLSPGYLSHLFKNETGTSIVKYITAYRLKRASELLRRTNMKIIDISSEVGYTNFSYFCTIFRNYYGATPTQYREED